MTHVIAGTRIKSGTFVANVISARLDSLSTRWLHVSVLFVCGLGFFLDLMEIGFSNSLAAIFTAQAGGASTRSVSILLSSIYVGAILGAPMFGGIADRHGRRKTLAAALCLLALSSTFAAASTSIAWLIFARCLTGVAVGAYQPVVLAYLTDLLPPKQRGVLFFAMFAFASLGIPAGTFLIRFLTPIEPLGIEGWRWGCSVGACGSAVAAFLALRLPESPRWLLSRGRIDEAETALVKFEQSNAVANTTPAGRRTPVVAPSAANSLSGPRLLVMGALFFVSPWSTVAFPILTGAALMGKGFDLSDALLYVGLANFGPAVGTLLAAFVVDRMGRRASLLFCAVLMLSSGYGFANSETPNWLVATSLAFSLAAALYIPILNIYCAELLATPSRASMLSGAWTANRVGAAIAPLCLLPLLHAAGTGAMFSVIAGSLLIGMVLLGVSMPGRQRLPVL